MSGSRKCPPGCTCGKHQRLVRPETRGRKLSAEHRRKISKSLRGKPLSDSQKKAISKGQIKRHERDRQQVVAPPDKKRCTKCRKYKRLDWDDFSMSEFPMRKRTLASGEVKHYPAGECKSCANDRAAAWREKERRAGRMSDHNRRWHKKTKAKDPDGYNRRQREWQSQYRRQKGIPARGPWKRYRTPSSLELLPIEPFSSWLSSQCVKRGVMKVSTMTGINDRQLRRIMSKRDERGKPIQSVTVKTADRICMGLGVPEELTILYPE